MNAQSISLANGHAHTQTQGVRTPLSGGTRPLQSKPFHSSGLGISSINRAAGLLSSLLLELILAQWPERLPFYIWSMSNPQMARSGQKCHVWLSRFWSTEQMADLAALLRLERLKKEKKKKGKIRAQRRSRSILFPWIQIDPCVIVRETHGCDVFIMSRPADLWLSAHVS